jgi:hypothetical protein
VTRARRHLPQTAPGEEVLASFRTPENLPRTVIPRSNWGVTQVVMEGGLIKPRSVIRWYNACAVLSLRTSFSNLDVGGCSFPRRDAPACNQRSRETLMPAQSERPSLLLNLSTCLTVCCRFDLCGGFSARLRRKFAEFLCVECSCDWRAGSSAAVLCSVRLQQRLDVYDCRLGSDCDALLRSSVDCLHPGSRDDRGLEEAV